MKATKEQVDTLKGTLELKMIDVGIE